MKLHFTFHDTEHLYIVTELASHGDLQAFLKNKRRAGHLPEATVWSFFIQMCLGVKTMHENNILHRDLKAANVFLCSNTFVKLGDLGVAKVLTTHLRAVRGHACVVEACVCGRGAAFRALVRGHA